MKNKPIYILILSVILTYITSTGYGQTLDLNRKLPADRKVRIGKLENGLSYYIRENKEPEGRAELYLAVNAGSLMEDDDQRGMAHFVEHMCFNGSKNFEKNKLVDFLQSIGMTFGADLNAYTGFDETVYMLHVPTENKEHLDTSFLVLKDWAHQVTFDPEEVEKERGIVLEEERLRGGAGQRIMEKVYPVLFRDSQYAERLPIGTKESIKNTPHAAITRFYEDWYRPELMAVVVVGDLDIDWAEQKIKENFSTIKPHPKPRKREQYKVPAKGDTEVVIATDKEFPGVIFFMSSGLAETQQQETLGDYKQILTEQLATSIINKRLEKRSQEEDPPFTDAGVNIGTFIHAREGHALFSQIALNKEKVEAGIRAGLREVWRAYQHGFYEGELKREKKNLKKAQESGYKERENIESASYAHNYVSHYLRKERTALLSTSFEYRAGGRSVDAITLEEVHEALKRMLENTTTTFALGSNDDSAIQLPSKEQILAISEEIRNSKLKPYNYVEVVAKLMENKPTPGAISSREEDEKIGVTELMLSNGVRVLLKPTDFKDDEIRFTAWSPGGMTLIDDVDYKAASMLPALMNEMGIGKLSNSDLKEVLAGKELNLHPYLEKTHEGLSGNTNPADLEAFFELLHLSFTAPREDKAALNSTLNKQKSQLSLMKNYPEVVYYDTLLYILAKGNVRREEVIPAEADLEKITIEQVMRIYGERFSNIKDFTFLFVGSFQVEDIIPYLKQYIASVPTTDKIENWKDRGVDNVLDEKQNTALYMGSEKTLVSMHYRSKKAYDLQTSRKFRIIGDMLNITLIEELREAESGVYQVRSYTRAQKEPLPYYEVGIFFGCSAENKSKLRNTAEEEIRKIQEGRFKKKTFDKAIEKNIKKFEKGIKENGYWLGQLSFYYANKLNPHDILSAKERIRAIKKEDVQKVAQEYIDLNRPIEVVLFPEAEKDKK